MRSFMWYWWQVLVFFFSPGVPAVASLWFVISSAGFVTRVFVLCGVASFGWFAGFALEQFGIGFFRVWQESDERDES